MQTVRVMKRVVVLTAMAFFGSDLHAADKNRAADARPNVVVIIVDDLGYGDLGIQGGKDIKTPNIDSIAQCGARFTNGYVTGPYCSPTRAGLISGRYQERTGHEFNPDGNYEDGPDIGLSLEESTIADAFKSAGYRTGAVGKWHLGVAPKFRPLQRGFEEFVGFLPAAHPYLVGPTSRPGNAKIPAQRAGKLLKNDDEVIDEGGYTTDVFGREAASFVKRHKDEPFFLYLATNAVHTPLEATQKYLDRFPDAEGKRKTYLAMLSALDDAVGQVLESVRESGVEDNTIIYFLSDNGGPEQANGSNNGALNGGKATVWEGGIRVPFFVQWKSRIPAGVTLDQPVAQIDIFPTSIAAADIPTPKDKKFDGKNILPLLTGKSNDAPHNALFWRFGKQWAVREGDWKLSKPAGVTTPQLFDLSTDIGEGIDRATEHPEIVERLTKAWAEWNKGNIDARWVPPAQQDGTKQAQRREARQAGQN